MSDFGYLLYPQVILSLWGPLIIFGLAALSRDWRQTLASQDGFWLSLGLLLLPVLIWFVPYLPEFWLREVLPYRVPLAWGICNTHLGMSRTQWLAMNLAWLIPLASMGLAALYGLAEEVAARWRVAQLPKRREGQVWVLDTADQTAFTLGLFRPRVYLSQGIWWGPHRAVIVAHEQGHARARHGLWLWLARSSCRSLWYWPAAGELLREVEGWAELLADEEAVEVAGKPALARALRDVLPTQAPAAALAFASSTPLLWRVQAALQPKPRLSVWAGVGLFLGFLALLILV